MFVGGGRGFGRGCGGGVSKKELLGLHWLLNSMKLLGLLSPVSHLPELLITNRFQ